MCRSTKLQPSWPPGPSMQSSSGGAPRPRFCGTSASAHSPAGVRLRRRSRSGWCPLPPCYSPLARTWPCAPAERPSRSSPLDARWRWLLVGRRVPRRTRAGQQQESGWPIACARTGFRTSPTRARAGAASRSLTTSTPDLRHSNLPREHASSCSRVAAPAAAETPRLASRCCLSSPSACAVTAYPPFPIPAPRRPRPRRRVVASPSAPPGPLSRCRRR